ncbi:hypothetical protein EHS13_08480 [Paenibacillus psychroresistens]|uniref:Uncharacterized protein n=1 Tax=Paenibacillus psychroresistens TaxID=1778678 RepID=A0A6B8REJ4_9BACL|nr:hypothetical protein [Paenibacillus psychroresistens]QGQ94911.1 hypothetical protein EHS13_08480 [Paenibacillus psychroresistens]
MKRIRNLARSSRNSWFLTVWIIQLWHRIVKYFRDWKNRRKRLNDSSLESSDVDSDLYNFLFTAPGSNPELLVDDIIWKKIAAFLPHGYDLPNSATMAILGPMSADYYNTLFSTTIMNPDVMVDGQVWTQITAALPQGYTLLDPTTKDVFNSMSGDLYNYLFAIRQSNPESIIDGEIWKLIRALLPIDYILPDPRILELLSQYQSKMK